MKILKLYFTWKFVIPFVLMLSMLVIGLCNVIKFYINLKFKKNCFECKYYNLYNVASVGNHCTYKCQKFNNINEHKINDKYNFIKCECYETKHNKI